MVSRPLIFIILFVLHYIRGLMHLDGYEFESECCFLCFIYAVHMKLSSLFLSRGKFNEK